MEVPENPAPTIKMSHFSGSSTVVRWLSISCSSVRQKGSVEFCTGNGDAALDRSDDDKAVAFRVSARAARRWAARWRDVSETDMREAKS